MAVAGIYDTTGKCCGNGVPGGSADVPGSVRPDLFFRGCGSLLVHAQRVRKEKGFAAACKASVHYLASGVRRNLKTLPRMAMYVLPVCALAVMVTVFNHTVRQPYALEVPDRRLCGQ